MLDVDDGFKLTAGIVVSGGGERQANFAGSVPGAPELTHYA
jgi:hypothetical protein